MILNIVLVSFLAAFIAFSIWNSTSLFRLSKKPLKQVDVNDKNYWELKYKMQYMITVFAVVVTILSFIGYSSLNEIKKDIQKNVDSQLDSSRIKMEDIERRQHFLDSKIAITDSSISEAEKAILGLTDRGKFLAESFSLRNFDLVKLKERIAEINSKNIIQQKIYIVENIPYLFNEYWEFKKYSFNDLTTNTGQPLPIFKKPPFIFSVSNQGFTFAIRRITAESFEMSAANASDPDFNDKNYKATLFITENP